MEYIKADASHIKTIAYLALLLWDHHNLDELISDFREVIQKDDCAVFLCFDNGVDIGLAQFALRFDYVEGTHIRPVGYVEGIYVREQFRKRGVAKRLIELGEAWAKEKGCIQLASDCELTNTNSLRFHLNCGFSEANRIICFVKDIGR